MLDLRSSPHGVILPVRAQPGARRAGLRGYHDRMLKVSVTTAAEKGKANQAIAAALCEELSLSRAAVELIAGATSRQKQFLIHGLDSVELQRRIDAALARVEAKE